MNRLFSCFRSAVAISFILIPGALWAQSSSSLVDASLDADGAASPGVTAAVSQKAVVPPQPLFSRWIELTNFSHSERYRNQYGDDGFHYFEDGQQRSVIAGKVKLDDAGKYSFGFRASSGRAFNWAYADYAGCGFTCSINKPSYDAAVSNPNGDPAVYGPYVADPKGVAWVEGVNSQGWEFYVRELYFSAHPISAVTLDVGSFNFERGFSTEITTFDDDGYLAGERIRLTDPKHLFFDQVTLTSAYFGNFNQPNLFARTGSFTKSNYRQVAAKKQLSQRVGISGEWNWISNNARTNTIREAIVVGVKESRFLDSFRIEGYEMLNRVSLQGDDERPRQGFAIVGEKKVGKLGGDFGFASIDRDYGLYSGSSFAQEIGFSLNGDNYNTGIRVFSHLNYKITPVVSVFGFYTRTTGQTITNINQQGLNAGLNFDLKALVNSGRQVF